MRCEPSHHVVWQNASRENLPLDENGKITDDTRIRGALPTLKKVLADGGSLIIMSHMGKPKGKVNGLPPAARCAE